MVSGAGERPAKSSLTSPVYVFPDCAPLWRAFAHLAYQYSKKYTQSSAMTESVRVRVQKRACHAATGRLCYGDSVGWSQHMSTIFPGRSTQGFEELIRDAVSSLKGQQWAECQKTCRRGAKRTQILAMGCSTPKLDMWRGCLACPENGRILLANVLQSSSRTFSCVSFSSIFAFKEGMWETPISALGGSPTVSGR